jgi:hypothetical protein
MSGPKKKRLPSGRAISKRYPIECPEDVTAKVREMLTDGTTFSMADLPAATYRWVWAGAEGAKDHLELLAVVVDERDKEIFKRVMVIGRADLTSRLSVDLLQRLQQNRDLTRAFVLKPLG